MFMLRSGSVALLLLVAVTACSGSDASLVPPDGGATDDAAAPTTADAAPEVDGDAATPAVDSGAETGTACSSLTLAAPPVDVEAFASAPPPPQGGALVDGTFVSTRAELYVGAGGDVTAKLAPVSVTVRIKGNVAETFVDGLARTATLSTSGTTLTAANTCPGTKVETVGYTATSDTIVVFMPRGKGTLVETLTRQ